MINRTIYITVVLLHLAGFLPSGINRYSGWEQADIHRLEQKTFKVDDEIMASKNETNEQWVEDIKNQIYNTVDPTFSPLTIADFD